MLAFDMHRMSLDAIQAEIVDRCADCGTVDALKLIPAEGERIPGIALVLMSSLEEAERLKTRIGDSLAGQIVLIFLRDQPQTGYLH
jgi:hypothetical protein